MIKEYLNMKGLFQEIEIMKQYNFERNENLKQYLKLIIQEI